MDERKREVARGRLILTHYSSLYLSHSLIPSSSCTVHSFVGPLLAPCLSRVRAPLIFFSLYLMPSLSYTHVHSSRLCLISTHITDISPSFAHSSFLSHSITPVSFPASRFFLARFLSPLSPLALARATGHVAPTRSPFFTPRIFSLSSLPPSSHQSDTSAAL